MQDSPNEIPRPGTPQSDAPQPEIPRYETLYQGTPQQSTPQPAPTRHDRPQRPLGVTLLSVLIGLEGLGELLIGILAVGALVALGTVVRAHGHTHLATAFDLIGWILGILPLVVGAITLIIAIGLFLLKRWAYWTTVGVSII